MIRRRLVPCSVFVALVFAIVVVASAGRDSGMRGGVLTPLAEQWHTRGSLPEQGHRRYGGGGRSARAGTTVSGSSSASEGGAFTEVTQQAGILHRHHKPTLDHKLDNINAWVSSVGAAVAAGDYDNDGWIDLYVTDSEKGFPNYLYRNNGDGTFTDVAARAGLADVNNDDGTSMDCIWGDYDNDGWVDLYVVRWGRDLLFRNNGNGTFSEVTQRCFTSRDGSPGTQWANGNAAIFWDYNLDGRLDIYVGNYFQEVDLWHLEDTHIMHDDFENARNAGVNFVYRQNADGTFSEVAEPLGLNDPGWTLAVGSADLNNDGWPDLYCADDFGPDQLFFNTGDGTFTNATETAIGFDSKKGMNVDFGDFNQDGWLDIYVANITTAEYLQEGNMLWHNNGPEPDGTVTFTDISLETGTYDGGWGWGAKFFDADNDADLDIYALNGFISAGEGNYWYDLASWTVRGEDVTDARNWPAIGNRSFSGYEPNRFWVNNGMFSFTEHAAEAGIDSKRDGRGLAVFDYDNDGDLDLFVANQDAEPHLYRNNLRSIDRGGTTRPAGVNHSLTVALMADPATGVNRDAVGARVTVVTAVGQQFRERDGGNGYSGQSDPRLHFGLGTEDHVRLLEVRWPDGGLQYLENVHADQIVAIRQDPAQYASQVAIRVGAPKSLAHLRSDARRQPAFDPAVVDQHLLRFEEQLRANPEGYFLPSAYREACVKYAAYDRSIDFFEGLVKESPAEMGPRVELACAYVDKIPAQGGVAAVVSKGTLARKSLDQLGMVINAEPDSWVAHYCRGMNHLHWPRALLHSEDAAADFRRCIALQEGTGAGNAKNYYVRAHVGLGDSLTKAKRYEEARQAWQRGIELFPDSDELKARLAIDSDREQLAYVEAQRSLEKVIDTNLSFLDRTE